MQRTIFLTLFLGAALWLIGASPAWATDVTNDVGDPGSAVVTVDPLVLAFITGSVIPLLTGLLTKLSTSSSVKAVLNLVLTVAAGVVAAFVGDPDSSLTFLEIATAAIAAYTSSQAFYTGLWRPTGAAAAAQRTGPISDPSV